VDDSAVTVLDKMGWVLGYAAGIGANVVCTGDLFSHSLYGSKYRYEVKSLFKKFKDSGFTFYSVSGNHSGDVDGNDVGSVKFREFGHFCLDGYVSYLGDGGQCGSLTGDGDNLVVGYPAYANGPVFDFGGGDAGKVACVVCHHWVVDTFGDPLVVYPDSLKKMFPNIRFAVYGHDHGAYDPYVSASGVMVVRPGSMMRTDSGTLSCRVPRVAVWYPGDRWEYVPIGCARPYGEVFFSERKSEDARSVDALGRFVSQMQGHGGVVMDVNSAMREQFALVPDEDKPLIREDLVSSGFVFS
jgi:hypothetical protein